MKPATSSTETIIALATPNGVGAIAVIRLSGPMAIGITNEVFASKALKSKQLPLQAANTIHFGVIHDIGLIIDEVLVSLFIGPHSYTGEDTVEISCHGSVFIQQQIIQLFTRKGVRMAQPGEFTLRAFLNGKMDLSQAEAVADLIASNSAASHQLAMQQMRGGFSQEIKALREQLIHFASLIELELDFAEEDVEFANRTDLKQLVMKLHKVIQRLLSSFETGNVLKNGVPVAIVGRPNAGKSTLLNALLNEERAIVSHIAGTTRDVIEDEVTLGGIRFRFIDTAGIRDTTDTIEAIGVARAYEKINQAQLIIYLFDVNTTSIAELQEELQNIKAQMNPSSKQHLIVIGNKIDEATESAINSRFSVFPDALYIAAKSKQGMQVLVEHLLAMVNSGALNENEVIVSNARHAEALFHTNEALQRVYTGLETNITGDLLAMDIRRSLYYLGEITGQVSTDDLLANIFSKFCIGK